MAAGHVEGEHYVQGTLLADAGESVEDAGFAVCVVVQRLQAHAAFVEDELEAVAPVFVLEEGGD